MSRLNNVIFAGQIALLPTVKNDGMCGGCGAYKDSNCLLSSEYYRTKIRGADMIYPCGGGSKNIPIFERKEMKGIRIDGQK